MMKNVLLIRRYAKAFFEYALEIMSSTDVMTT